MAAKKPDKGNKLTPTTPQKPEIKELKSRILRAIDVQLDSVFDRLAAGTYTRPDNGGYYTRPD